MISAACGATGISACQLAQAWGWKVAAIVGSNLKVDFLKKELNIQAFSYKGKDTNDLIKEISESYPYGFDVYFDNVGGEILDGMLSLMKNYGVIVSCGSLNIYNKELKNEYKNMWQLILKRLRLEGFIVYDYQKEYINAYNEIWELIKEGRFKFFEDMKQGGVEMCPIMMENFYKGENIGKYYLKII